MPDGLDMPDWRNPADPSVVMRWDPTSQRYVSGEDQDEDPPMDWQGAGQTLDPAIHTVRPKNPDATGIMASASPSFGDRVQFAGEAGPPDGPQPGESGTVVSAPFKRKDGLAVQVEYDSLGDRRGGHPWPTLLEHLRPDEPLTIPEGPPVVNSPHDGDSPEQIEHMVNHASVTANASKCPNCPHGVMGPDGVCEQCHYQQHELTEHAQPRADLGPFPDRVPKQNYMTTDHEYPSLASAPKRLRSEMRAFPEHESSWEHDLRHADASLDACPGCGGSMVEGPHGAKCAGCDLKQPAVTMAAHEKTAWAPLVAAGGIALRALGQQALKMGLKQVAKAGVSQAAKAGAGAAAGEAAAGGAAAGTGAATGGGGLMSGVGQAMRGVSTANGAATVTGVGGDQPAQPQQPAEVQQPLPSSTAPAAMIAGAKSNEESQSVFIMRGDDDHPENDGTRGFQEQHSDAPEFLKDVNDLGGTSEGEDADADLPEDWMHELGGMSDEQLDALQAFGEKVDHIIMLSESEHDESADEIFQSIDAALESVFPGYKGHPDEGDKKESSVSTHEMLEKVAARRPKLCPAHTDLIDASLIEQKSLLGQFAPSNYGSNYCKSPEFDGKCNFKPAMTTQKFWDDKDAEAIQRKEEREQAAEQQRADELSGTTLDPAEHEVDFDEAPTAEWESDDTDMGSSEYAPGLSDAPSAVGGPMPVAAKVASVEVGTAVRRKTHTPSPDDPVGVVVELTTVHPSSPGRATVRFEGGHEESIPVMDLEAADGGVDMGHPTMDYGVSAPGAMDPTADMDPIGDPYGAPAGSAPYSYASVKEAEHDERDTGHTEDADQFDFGHGAPAHQSETAVADDGQDEAGVKDDNGHPLREGSVYMMSSADYSVPDKVTIDKIAGSDITYTIHTGQMDFQDTLSVADLELQKLTFKPVEASPEEGSPEEMADDVPAPTEHQHADDGGNLSDFKAAGAKTAYGDPDDPPETCPACSHKLGGPSGFDCVNPACSDYDGDDPEGEENECYCGKKKSNGLCPDCDKDEKTASVPDEHIPWHTPELSKTAGKDYSSREIRELIEEGEGKLARNFDSLDLTQTHYTNDISNTDDWLY